jgi:hypothetical protein
VRSESPCRFCAINGLHAAARTQSHLCWRCLLAVFLSSERPHGPRQPSPAASIVVTTGLEFSVLRFAIGAGGFVGKRCRRLSPFARFHQRAGGLSLTGRDSRVLIYIPPETPISNPTARLLSCQSFPLPASTLQKPLWGHVIDTASLVIQWSLRPLARLEIPEGRQGRRRRHLVQQREDIPL